MRHILTGRIASSNDTLALTLRLYPRGNDQPIWIESFSGNTNELIALEWRALSALANRLGLRLSADEQQRIRVLLTNNLEALRCYQQADEVYNRKTGTQTGYREARELAQKAMRLDPHFLAADLHDIYMLRNLAQDRAPVEVWPDVKIRILRILEKDETFAPACELLAGYYFCFERDWEQAYAHWNRELLYLPKRDRLWIGALWRRYYGWYDEARPEQEESETPEPMDIDHRWTLASSRWTERRYAEGAQAARRTLEIYRGNAEGYQWLAQCLVANGNYVEGIEATLKAQEAWKTKQDMTALRAYAYARMGQPEKAREVLRELLDIEKHRRLSPALFRRSGLRGTEREGPGPRMARKSVPGKIRIPSAGRLRRWLTDRSRLG
jgi:hypothetical protein